jgi:chromatin structure-remodeling complex subunit RSC3/30
MRLGLPIFLRWSPENEHPSAASLHLEFLYQDFLLCQMLVERTGDGSNSLIEKSLEILVLLLDIVSKQTRAGNVSHFTIFDVSGPFNVWDAVLYFR